MIRCQLAPEDQEAEDTLRARHRQGLLQRMSETILALEVLISKGFIRDSATLVASPHDTFHPEEAIVEKRHFGAAERLWIADEIEKLLPVARDTTRAESQWADNLIRNAYLWYWTADGINAKGKVKRDLFKRDPAFLRHTAAAAAAIREGRKVTHEHAVPRKVLLQYLKQEKWASPSEIKRFLDCFCFGVIIDTEREEHLLKPWKQKMPTSFSAGSEPLERYHRAQIEVKEPTYPRSE